MPEFLHEWVDNHCHLGHPGRDDDRVDPAARLATGRDAGVVGFVDVGTDLQSSREALGRAAAHADVFATAGVHPHEADGGIDGLRDLIEEHLGGDLVAVGECGLDHHYNHSAPSAQRRVFAAQVELAHEFDLPLVIHTREAWDGTFTILDDLGTPPRTVFHCFTGGPSEAEGCLERGAMLSISGIVTFPSATDIRDAVAVTPLSSLMTETDSPYLAPVPHRGRTNQPGWVGLIGAEIARVLEVPVAEVAAATTLNAARFYGRQFGSNAASGT